MYLLGAEADLPVLNIGLLEVNLINKTVQVDDQIYFRAKAGEMDLLIFFQERNYRVPRGTFNQLYRRYKYGGVGDLLGPTDDSGRASSTLVSIRNKGLIRYGLIIVCDKGIYQLKKVDPACRFNSQKEYPEYIYRSIKHGLEVFRFRDGIEFRDIKTGRKLHMSSFSCYGGRLNKNITYIDEKGRRHKYYKISELKELAAYNEIRETIFIGITREMISKKII